MDPILGALISAGISGIFGMSNQAFANKYNTPKSQLKRLRKAGLPLSYMYQGKVNQQSSVPSLSIDPDLGTVESFKASQQLKTDQAMLDNMAIQKEILGYERDLKKGERDWNLEDSQIDSLNNFLLGPITNQESRLNIRHQMELSGQFIKEHEQKLKVIFSGVEQTLFDEGVTLEQRRKELERIKAQIKVLASQDKLMGQLNSIRQMEQKINEAISMSIDTMPDFVKAFWALLMKLYSPASTR